MTIVSMNRLSFAVGAKDLERASFMAVPGTFCGVTVAVRPAPATGLGPNRLVPVWAEAGELIMAVSRGFGICL